MEKLNSSRVLGALLCVASAVVAILHIGIGYLGLFGAPRIPLAFALPITVMVLVATGLGFWLGWIMVTTKESQPASAPEPEEKPEKESEESEN